MNFRSDNNSPVHEKVMRAIQESNTNSVGSYGDDHFTQVAKQRFSEIFERDVEVVFVATGTAANVLSLSCLTQGFGAIYCHESAHINHDETYAPNGAKIIPIHGQNGKMDLESLVRHIERNQGMRPHSSKPMVIHIGQSTDLGTVHTPDHIRELSSIAHGNGMHLHMDGARFTNALVSLGVTPADMTWKAGVDVLSFGATKNGCMAAEAVVFFKKELAESADYYQKYYGHLMSKMRYFSCQFMALFHDNLWIKNAMHANNMATKVVEILIRNEGVQLLHPVDANEVFVVMPDPMAKTLREQGFMFYDWGLPGQNMYRFVTSFVTHQSDIQALQNSCIIALEEGYKLDVVSP